MLRFRHLLGLKAEYNSSPKNSYQCTKNNLVTIVLTYF